MPEGWRPLRPEDAAQVAEVIAEDEAWLGRTPRVGEADVRSWWLRTDLANDSWLLEEDGRTTAFGWMELHGEMAFFGAVVRPGAKGRGLGALLVDRAEKHARSRGAIRIFIHGCPEDDRALELFEARGYREARRHWEMAIDLTEEPAPATVPGDLVLDTFRDEDAREFHDATTEAFANEWGFVSQPFDRWWEMRRNDDHSLWFVVRDGERIAAYARCEGGRRGGGYVGMLGVRRAWRRQGLGLALLRHAFGEFWRRGERRVFLGVDAENPTGATRLYELAGMHVVSEDVTFEKELA